MSLLLMLVHFQIGVTFPSTKLRKLFGLAIGYAEKHIRLPTVKGDTSTFPELAKHKFVYFIAGDKGKAYADIKSLEAAAEKDSVQYTFAEWSAKLPEERQSELAAVMLEKGAPVNMFQFEPGTVLPSDGKGSEHMYSFDFAYRIPSVKEWLFRQSK